MNRRTFLASLSALLVWWKARPAEAQWSLKPSRLRSIQWMSGSYDPKTGIGQLREHYHDGSSKLVLVERMKPAADGRVWYSEIGSATHSRKRSEHLNGQER